MKELWAPSQEVIGIGIQVLFHHKLWLIQHHCWGRGAFQANQIKISKPQPAGQICLLPISVYPMVEYGLILFSIAYKQIEK